MSGQITPTPTGRQVIPFGDRPIIDVRTGNATFDMYQWMQRITAGFGATITNVSETISQTNVNTTEITQINTDVSGIEAEIADILNTIGMLEGWVQVFLNQSPSPPAGAPPIPARSLPAGAPFPPAPPKWQGAADFIELESGGVPTKISAMPTASLPTAGTEVFPLVQSNGNVSLPFPIFGGGGSGTIMVPISDTDFLQIQTTDQTVAATNSQDLFLFTGAPGSGGDTGAANYGTGDNNVSGASGVTSLYTGAVSGGAGQSGGVFVFSGDTSGTGQTGNAWVYTGNTAAGTANTGDVNILTGDSFGGASGNIHLTTGAAATTRGEIILNALDLWLDAAGFWSANGAVATALTSVGPTGSHTTVQEWLTVKNASGVVRYVPAF